jgi:hypothetical protein
MEKYEKNFDTPQLRDSHTNPELKAIRDSRVELLNAQLKNKEMESVGDPFKEGVRNIIDINSRKIKAEQSGDTKLQEELEAEQAAAQLIFDQKIKKK